MVAKNRHSLPVDPKFVLQLKELRKKVFASGGETSLRQLTEQIANPKIFSKIEKDVLDIAMNDDFGNLIKFDKRRRL